MSSFPSGIKTVRTTDTKSKIFPAFITLFLMKILKTFDTRQVPTYPGNRHLFHALCMIKWDNESGSVNYHNNFRSVHVHLLYTCKALSDLCFCLVMISLCAEDSCALSIARDRRSSCSSVVTLLCSRSSSSRARCTSALSEASCSMVTRRSSSTDA